jgi:hypothetical protein
MSYIQRERGYVCSMPWVSNMVSLLLKRMKVRQFHRFTSRDFTRASLRSALPSPHHTPHAFPSVPLAEPYVMPPPASHRRHPVPPPPHVRAPVPPRSPPRPTFSLQQPPTAHAATADLAAPHNVRSNPAVAAQLCHRVAATASPRHFWIHAPPGRRRGDSVDPWWKLLRTQPAAANCPRSKLQPRAQAVRVSTSQHTRSARQWQPPPRSEWDGESRRWWCGPHSEAIRRHDRRWLFLPASTFADLDCFEAALGVAPVHQTGILSPAALPRWSPRGGSPRCRSTWAASRGWPRRSCPARHATVGHCLGVWVPRHVNLHQQQLVFPFEIQLQSGSVSLLSASVCEQPTAHRGCSPIFAQNEFVCAWGTWRMVWRMLIEVVADLLQTNGQVRHAHHPWIYRTDQKFY